jgi:hypothetical protein
MFQRFFAGAQAVPSKVHIATGTLKLSERVYWLDSRRLLDPLPYVQRHRRGDWGDVDDQQRRLNQDAISNDGALYSLYQVTPTLALVVITGAGRNETVIQLQEEKSLF